jgi:peptidyl-prolyl cis-trans isomerase A (cyclophilin A)
MMHRSTRAITALMATLFALGATGTRADEPASTAPAQAGPAQAPAAPPVEVVLHTQAGDIVIALDAQHAPLTTANFLQYVDQKRFDGGEFYRAVKVDEEGHYGLVQGGLDRRHAGQARPAKAAKGIKPVKPPRPIPPVPHESPAVTGLHHVDGAISMARKEPGTATSEFFIVIGDLVSLDGGEGDPGYAVFGHVASGMDVVTGMLGLPRSTDAGDGSMAGQMLASPVKILAARRVEAAEQPSLKGAEHLPDQ